LLLSNARFVSGKCERAGILLPREMDARGRLGCGCWRSTNISPPRSEYSLFRVCVPWAAFSRDWTPASRFDADAKYIIIPREVRFSRREPIGGAWEPSSLRNYICISVINNHFTNNNL
jgi:hypothetical protein